MKLKLLLTILSLCFLSCSEQNSKPLEFQVEKIAILAIPKDSDLLKYKEAELENQDIVVIENLLRLAVTHYNAKQVEKIPEFQRRHTEIITAENVTIDFSNYKRQYVPYINHNGEKMVWVYCMLDRYAHNLWKSEVLYSAGGGDMFFEITLNLTTKTTNQISINGPA